VSRSKIKVSYFTDLQMQSTNITFCNILKSKQRYVSPVIGTRIHSRTTRR